MSHGPLPVGVVDGDGEGDGDEDGDEDADGELLGLDDGEPLATVPVHATPLRLNAVGTGFELVHEPLKPKLVLPPVATEPL
jgi:hypothetical protein